jgi:hypothetical protein
MWVMVSEMGMERDDGTGVRGPQQVSDGMVSGDKVKHAAVLVLNTQYTMPQIHYCDYVLFSSAL